MFRLLSVNDAVIHWHISTRMNFHVPTDIIGCIDTYERLRLTSFPYTMLIIIGIFTHFIPPFNFYQSSLSQFETFELRNYTKVSRSRQALFIRHSRFEFTEWNISFFCCQVVLLFHLLNTSGSVLEKIPLNQFFS